MAAGVLGGVIAWLVIVAAAGGVLFWKLRPAPVAPPSASVTAGAACVAPVQATSASVAVVAMDADAVPDPRRGGKVTAKASKDGGAEQVDPSDASPTAAKDGGAVKPPASASAQPASPATPKTPKTKSASSSAPRPAPASS